MYYVKRPTTPETAVKSRGLRNMQLAEATVLRVERFAVLRQRVADVLPLLLAY